MFNQLIGTPRNIIVIYIFILSNIIYVLLYIKYIHTSSISFTWKPVKSTEFHSPSRSIESESIS